MKSLLLTIIFLSITISSMTTFAEGLPVERYLADPEHKDDIIGFYLNTLFTGINMVNNRIEPPLFCLDESNPEPAFMMLDSRLQSLKDSKKLTPGMTVDNIMLELLMDEFPCHNTPK